jgi:thioredoxin-related protein
MYRKISHRFSTTFLLIALLACLAVQAAPRLEYLPAFTITKVDGKKISSRGLPKGKPVLLVYFSPDCDHCISLSKELLKNYANLKGVQLLMVSYQKISEVTKFDRQFSFSIYPNVIIGSEVKPLFLQKYFKVQHTPFVVLYNKSGKKYAKFEGPEISIAKVLEKIQHMMDKRVFH